MLPREKHAGRGQPRKEISHAAILLPKLADIGIEENRARRAKKLNATSKPKRKQIVEKLKTDGKGCHAGRCARKKATPGSWGTAGGRGVGRGDRLRFGV